MSNDPELFKSKKKKSNRNSKKKEYLDMLDDFNLDKNNDNYDKSVSTYGKNFKYLSNKEKDIFENKFSVPKNESQKRFLKYLNSENYKILIASGPAGTGKTLFSIEQGVKNFLLEKYEKIILTRPSVSVDEDLGYLPGTLEEKMAPWVRPIYDVLYNFITPKEVEQLIVDKIIEICPLGFMRGRTFKNSWIIADEMQNSTIAQMKMLLTRIGENTRLVITGDLEQNDMKYEMNGLEDFLNKMKGRRSDSINSIEFNKSDIERENVVREVIDIYRAEEIPYQYKINDNTNKNSNDSNNNSNNNSKDNSKNNSKNNSNKNSNENSNDNSDDNVDDNVDDNGDDNGDDEDNDDNDKENK
jgi:phosphate starvation-inducible PhoH-like protein